MKENIDQVERILNCEESLHKDKDWTIEESVGEGALEEAMLPPSVDLREDWWGIGDQGSTGSCVGWATADSVLRYHFVKANRIAQDERLSVRYVWMASKEIDEFTSRPTGFIEGAGTSLKAALDVARKYGVVKEELLSFMPITLSKLATNAFYIKAANLRINSYFNLSRSAYIWRYWLANKGPILTRLDVDATWWNVGSDGNLDAYVPPEGPAGHAVAIVGYTPGGFIVRNSWGTGWGEDGFAYASNAYAQDAFNEAYGVTVS